jgi:class 3 adenylate cyclase
MRTAHAATTGAHASRSIVRDPQGTLVYVPGGVTNPFSRTCFVIPDEETVRRIEALEQPWEGLELGALALFVATIGALAVWRPWGITYMTLALIVLGASVVVLPLPALVGASIARRLGLSARERPRTFAEVSRGYTQPLGPDWMLLLMGVAGVAVLGLVFWFGRGAIARGETDFVFFAGLVMVTAVTSAPLYFLGLRGRRVAAENARLESVVSQRTEQLREVQRTLEERVAQQVREIERLGQLRHFFAAPVAEMILQEKGFDPARVHRKEITAISVDLQGFTAFSETAEPEDVIEVLRAYHAVLGALVNKYRATLEHFAGENAMVFLNDPLDAPDHPASAMAMAVELRSAMQPLLEQWRQGGHEFGLGTGIATGYATIGTVGYEGRWEYAAVGSVCNLAARLCAEAGNGQVITTHRVLSRAQAQPRVESLGNLTLKGFSRPVEGFNIVSLP